MQPVAGTLSATKGTTVSDSSSPIPSSETPRPAAPPAPPAPPSSWPGTSGPDQPTAPFPPTHATQPTVPYPPQTQPQGAPIVEAAHRQSQAYPGAAPAYSPPPASPGYGLAPAAAQSTYNTAPAQPASALYNGQYAPAPRPTSGLALTSLICGIAGVALFWLFVPMLASIVAVITGHLALRQVNTNAALGGRGMAIAGLIMGYIMVAFLLFSTAVTLFSVLFFGAFTLPFIFSG